MVPTALTARQAAVLTWWPDHSRDLPWRATRDPWEILVCEVMAQQTQVARVIERWRPFLGRFPTPESMAAAPIAEVIRWWSGLGYNRRARDLHRCATEIVTRHAGTLPADLAGLLALPGIGPYTARAVLTFAFELDHGVVDTNTARIIARWNGRSLTAREAQHAADAGVPPGQSWAWNQALLDLATSVCTRRVPRCHDCPVQHLCRWGHGGQTTPDPADGSAGVSGGQPRFEGSDRQGRGRLIEALRAAPVPLPEVAAAMGWPADQQRARRVAAALVADGLVEEAAGSLRLS